MLIQCLKGREKSVIIPLESKCSQYKMTNIGYVLVLFSFLP